MILKCIGSSSKGNGYLLQASTGESLAIEAGVPLKDLLRASEYNRASIVGCIVSHRHSDHAKFTKEYHDGGIRIYSHEDVPFVDTILKDKKWHSIKGEFSVLPFSVEHDVPNFGYIIKHREIDKMLFATDCAHIPTIFKGLRNFLIEANYSDDALLLSNTDNAQKTRIMKSHMSLEYCIDYLKSADADKADNIILIHLSSRHSNASKFLDRVECTFGVPCFTAHRGATINL